MNTGYTRRRFLGELMATGAALPPFSLSAVRPAHAQDYPNRPIKLIVPFPPGGPSDVMARLVTPRLQAILGQPVVVENRAGAGGAIGTRTVATSPPDGYTLLLANTSFTVTPAISKKAGFDAQQSFSAISQMSESCLVLTVPSASSTKSVGDLVSSAKATPRKLNYGSPGPGEPRASDRGAVQIERRRRCCARAIQGWWRNDHGSAWRTG